MKNLKKLSFLDLLLVDDIHLLAGKEGKSLVEFFIHFNALLDESKQIILTQTVIQKNSRNWIRVWFLVFLGIICWG